MTTDFNPPSRLIFDHYLSSDGTVVSSDELRKLFLNYLIYKGPASEAKLTNDFNLNQIVGLIQSYCELVQESDNRYTLRFRVDPSIVPGNGHSLLLAKFLDLVQQADTSGVEIHQDYNFEPEGIGRKDDFSLSVRTVARELQKTDISSDDDFFTGGELNPDKDETTLKFAYAFKTTKIEGELELVSKQTKLATNYEKWQVEADNENEKSKDPISKLKNLIYFASQTDSIEKNIEAEGGEGDIGIDKAYNVVTIQVPPLDQASVTTLTYTTSPATPKINGVSTQNIKEGLSQYDAAILDYFLSELDGVSNTKTKGLITGFADYVARYYGFTVNDAASFRDNPANSIVPVTKQLDLYNERIAKQKSLKEQLATAITNFLADSSLQDYEKFFDSLKYDTSNKQFQIFTLLSTPFNFDKFSAKAFAMENPQNVTMANLFKGAMPVDNLGKGYSYGPVQKNLVRRGRLIGLKLVKSEQPLDTDFYQNWLDSVVQTYHIPIRLKEDAQQVRIFDSQIIYGKTYYYTLLGVYNVDGKFYYYDNLSLGTEKQPPVLEQEKVTTEAKAQGDKFEPGDYPNGLPKQLFNASGVGSYVPQSGKHKFILRLETPPREETVTELVKEEVFRPDGSSEIIETTRTQTDLVPSENIFYLIEQDPSLFTGLRAKVIGSAPPGNFNQFIWGSQGIKQEIEFEYDVVFSSGDLITLELIDKIQQKTFFKNFSFDLFESNSSRIFELPLQPSLEVDNIDVAPVAPDATFVALADVNNKIKIRFDETVQFDYLAVEPDAAFNTLNVSGNKSLVEKVKLKSKEIQPDLKDGMVLARSENDLSQIHARKLDRPPTSLQDLVDNGEKFVLDYSNGETAYISNVIPNQKYYYTFISRDIVGLYSNASFTYEVEVVEDSGYVYARVGIYDYPVEDNKVTTKTFQKLLKVKPSFEQLQPSNASSIGEGFSGVYTTTVFPDGSQLNPGGQPPKFKIRVRSKKSKRAFDINLKYTQKVQPIQTKALLKQIEQHSELIDEEISGA
jgi:hypothetical protein